MLDENRKMSYLSHMLQKTSLTATCLIAFAIPLFSSHSVAGAGTPASIQEQKHKFPAKMKHLFCELPSNQRGMRKKEFSLRARDGHLIPVTTYSPRKAGPHPVILFLGGTKESADLVFAKLAHCLQQQDDYIVVGYDPVGTGKQNPRYDDLSSKNEAKRKAAKKEYERRANISWKTFLEEPRTILRHLFRQPTVDRNRIFIMGSSEGTFHTVRLAETEKKVPIRGLIMIGGPGESMVKAGIWQNTFRVQAIRRYLKGKKFQKQQQAAEETEQEVAVLKKMTHDIQTGKIPHSVTEGQPMPARHMSVLYRKMGARYQREALFFNCAKFLRETNKPVLILMGNKDINVNAAQGREATHGAGSNVRFVELENADHSLLTETRSFEGIMKAMAAAMSKTEGNAVQDQLPRSHPQFIPLIAEWLKNH